MIRRDDTGEHKSWLYIALGEGEYLAANKRSLAIDHFDERHPQYNGEDVVEEISFGHWRGTYHRADPRDEATLLSKSLAADEVRHMVKGAQIVTATPVFHTSALANLLDHDRLPWGAHMLDLVWLTAGVLIGRDDQHSILEHHTLYAGDVSKEIGVLPPERTRYCTAMTRAKWYASWYDRISTY